MSDDEIEDYQFDGIDFDADNFMDSDNDNNEGEKKKPKGKRRPHLEIEYADEEKQRETN